MADLLQPTNSNRENLDAFITSIEDADLQKLIRDHLEDILKTGDPSAQENRQTFFTALEIIINKRIKEDKL